MRCQIGLALLTIVISSAAGNVGQLFPIAEPSKVSSDEPQVVEVVRWRQPVCVESAVDVPPCLLGLGKSHTDNAETVDGKVKKSIDLNEDVDRITGVLSPNVVDTFSLEPLELSGLEMMDLEELAENSQLIRSTPELDTIEDPRSGKLLVLPSFEKLASLKSPPIFATRVLNSPVTATLVAKNCFPDIGVPLCEEGQGNKDKPNNRDHSVNNPSHDRRPGRFWEDPRSPYYDGGAGRLLDIPQEIPKFGRPIFENFRNAFLNPDASPKHIAGKIADIKQNVQSIFDAAVQKLKQVDKKEEVGLVQKNGDDQVGIPESIHSLVDETSGAEVPSVLGAQKSVPEGNPPSPSSSDIVKSVDNIKEGNFWEDPKSPYYDGGAERLADIPKEAPKLSKPIFDNFHDFFPTPDASSKPVVSKIVNIKQNVQSIFDVGMHKLKQNRTKVPFGSVHGNADVKSGIIETIHSLLGKGSSAVSFPHVNAQTHETANKHPSPSPVDIGVGKITDNMKKAQSVLQNFHDMMKKPFKKPDISPISPPSSTVHEPSNPQEPLSINKNHSFLQSVHDIVKKPFQKAETIISQIKTFPGNQSKPSITPDLTHHSSDQPPNKHLFLQTIHDLVNKSYQHFQTPVIPHLNPKIPNENVAFVSKDPEIKDVLVIEKKPAPKPNLFEHFWQPGAIFEKHTTPTANPRPSTATTGNPGTFGDWQGKGMERTASVPADSNVRESISPTLIEVPEEPASENGVKDKGSEVPGWPAAEPRLLDTSNPVKSTIGRDQRDLSKGIFGSLGHAFVKSTNPPLLVKRPNQKPLLVRRPIYVVEKPASYGSWWNPFSKPTHQPARSYDDYEAIVEPVYIFEKPQQHAGAFKQFLQRPDSWKNWNVLLGKHSIFMYKNPTMDDQPVEINGQTSSVIRYPQKLSNVHTDSGKTGEVSKKQEPKNALDNHRQSTRASDK